jgi:hypothetical protein
MAQIWGKPPPYSIFCAWPRGQHPNVILFYDSQVGIPKFPKLGLLQLWRPITLCANLWLKWCLKKSCNPRRELSNSMWRATCTQGNHGDSWLLVVGSQIDKLILDISFGHILCFSAQMGHATHFRHLSSQKFSNDIKNSSILWVLTFAIAF